MMKTKKEYIVVTPTLGEFVLNGANSWDDVESKLYDCGYVNMGKLKVIERTYELVNDVSMTYNTDYE